MILRFKSLNISAFKLLTVPFAIKFFNDPSSIKKISISEISRGTEIAESNLFVNLKTVLNTGKQHPRRWSDDGFNYQEH